MKKGLIFLFLGFAVICKAGLELDYGLQFSNGGTGLESDKFKFQTLHAGLGLDLTEKLKIELNAACKAEMWESIKKLDFNNLYPTFDVTIRHKF